MADTVQTAQTPPSLECDLVMKGGITSGVIYPRLVSALSNVYRLRSIGGTSAGAIAAAAAAAAQLGVLAGTNTKAFEKLSELPDDLGKSVAGTGSKLFHLFQPHPSLANHFAVLTAFLKPTSTERSKSKPFGLDRTLRIGGTLIREFLLGAILGAIPGIILMSQSWGFAQFIALLILLIGVLVGAAVHAALSLGRELPAKFFGLCSGMPGAGNSRSAQSLTPFLHDLLNTLAGKALDEPLTFGELWAGQLRAPGQATPPVPDGKRAIDLAMMTTALNLGRPYRLPFESNDIYFVQEEINHLFPEQIASWLSSHARPSSSAADLSVPGRTLRALPLAQDFPVVVAVRLSLSFPVLLSTLPLYAIDRTLKVNQPKPTRVTRVYFSDGGLCSNFPVHFFDSPLPSHPTFAVNLRDFHPDHPKERVFLPEVLENDRGLRNYVPELSNRDGWRSVFAFIRFLIETMQSWRDQMQLAMPGFRDRIVHVSHTAEEGGINLSMPPEFIQVLANSGVEAADKLIAAFARQGGIAPGWANHQRIRVRTLLRLLEQQIQALSKSLRTVHDRAYSDVVTDPKPPSYPFTGRRRSRRPCGFSRNSSELQTTWPGARHRCPTALRDPDRTCE